jgi:magnesium-transporting ATPase (P-type)
MFIKNPSPHIVLLQILFIFLANIILIGLIIYEQKNQDKLSNNEKKVILYSELILSFIGSSVLLLFMSYILRIPFSHLYIPYFIYSLVIILTSPFALIIIRIFLPNKTYIKNINILLIISILFSMFFTSRVGR